jgi:hypothetical protein
LAVAAAVIFLVGQLGVVRAIEHSLARACPAEPDLRQAFAGLPVWAVAATIPLTQWVQMVGIIKMTFSRRVTWRGVSYEIHRANRVRRLDHPPFAR